MRDELQPKRRKKLVIDRRIYRELERIEDEMRELAVSLDVTRRFSQRSLNATLIDTADKLHILADRIERIERVLRRYYGELGEGQRTATKSDKQA